MITRVSGSSGATFTLAELLVSRQGSAHRAGTPADVIDKLNKEINTGLADAKIRARLADVGGVPMPMTPAEFGKFSANEIAKWGQGDHRGEHQGGLGRQGLEFNSIA
jgi:hypothetical protein